MNVRPIRIGMSACFLPPRRSRRKVFNGRPLVYIEQSMPHYLQSQGALVYLIPPDYAARGTHYDQIAADLDGLVLVGGVDVSPLHYGEKPRRPSWRGDPQRDRYDMALFAAFRKLDKPIFGICRGLQLINVALGGALYQDLLTQHQGSLVHREADDYEQNNHRVALVEGGLLASLYGQLNNQRINSVHHQGIKVLGAGLRVEALSPEDGVIEAVSLPRSPQDRHPTCFAVQWHPEFQEEEDASFLHPQVLLTYFMQSIRRQIEVPHRERAVHYVQGY